MDEFKTSQSANPPLVSIVMGVYNGERYLKEAIDSMLNQTQTNFEFIIINDGSTDSTGEILHAYTDPRVFILEQENHGLTKSLNRGIALARGKYIARMDSDEISMSNRLEKQIEYLENNFDVGAVGTSYNRIDAIGSIIGQEIISVPVQKKDIYKNLFEWCFLLHGSVMMRKEVLDMVGWYDENFLYSQDYDLWFRILDHYSLGVLSEPLFCWRLHPDSIYSSKQTTAIHYRYLARRLSALRKSLNKSDYEIEYKSEIAKIERTIALTRQNIPKHIDLDSTYKHHLAAAYFRYGNKKTARMLWISMIRSRTATLHTWVYLSLTLLPPFIKEGIFSFKNSLIGAVNYFRYSQK
jgi:glycosyltransferase involved in cell wall biosynthesis